MPDPLDTALVMVDTMAVTAFGAMVTRAIVATVQVGLRRRRNRRWVRMLPPTRSPQPTGRAGGSSRATTGAARAPIVAAPVVGHGRRLARR
ncbi:MAG TPA: hypothetical protein VGG05_02755 [Pseudonocardiaceae bacterium]|jgi:hypothetical protein